MTKPYHCSLEQMMDTIRTPSDYWMALGDFHKDYTRFCQTEDSVLGNDLVERVKALILVGNAAFVKNPVKGARRIYDAFDSAFNLTEITIDIIKRLKKWR